MVIAMPTIAVARYFEAADVIASDAAASGNVRAVTPITMKDAGVLSNGTWLVSQAAEAIQPLAGHRQTGALAVVSCTQTVVLQQCLGASLLVSCCWPAVPLCCRCTTTLSHMMSHWPWPQLLWKWRTSKCHTLAADKTFYASIVAGHP